MIVYLSRTVTNFQSKRKTPTAITFYRGERMFGADSIALMARKPDLTFTRTFRMLGRSVDHPAITEFPKQYFPYVAYTNETTKALTLKQEETYYTPEELIGMMLDHARLMTANFGGKKIKDCVITVPSFFTQHERAALFAAAEMADLNVLSLIEENTAAALHYGVDRVFEQPETVVFYNMGAASVQVTVVTYSSYQVKEGGKNKTVGQFEVVGKAWDSSLGGFNFDVALTELLADRFNSAWSKKPSGNGKDLRDFVVPMTKLRIQANKVKEVLSANAEFPVKIEQLHADVDLSTKVSRAEFEEACSDLFARVTDPVTRALAMANVTVADIHSVEILGGAVRIPKLKKELDEYFKDAKAAIGQHMNGDESMALGAAFRAANISTQFRVRKVGATDISNFGISVRLETLPEDEASSGLFGKKKATESEETWTKKATVFPAVTPLPSKVKTVAFQYDKDIVCNIEYDDEGPLPLPEGTDKLVAMFNITGVANFAKETASKGLGAPKVHLSFGLDSSGLVQLVKAEATLELPPEPEDVQEVSSNSTEPTKEESSEASESETTNDATPAADTNSTNTEASETSTNSTKTDNKKSDDKDMKKPIKKKPNTLRKTLLVKLNYKATTPPLKSPEEIAESKARLQALQEIDDIRAAKAAALNDLEAYIYKVKNQLSDREDELKQVSTDEQRQEVVDLANETEEWLYDEGRDQTVAVYNAKQKAIKDLAQKIFKRFTEIEARDKAVAKARKSLKEVKKAVSDWDSKMPHVTDAEKQDLLKAVKLAEDWLEKKLEAQDKVAPHETPAFDSSEVPQQLKSVSLLFDKLMKKPKPAPPVSEKVGHFHL